MRTPAPLLLWQIRARPPKPYDQLSFAFVNGFYWPGEGRGQRETPCVCYLKSVGQKNGHGSVDVRAAEMQLLFRLFDSDGVSLSELSAGESFATSVNVKRTARGGEILETGGDLTFPPGHMWHIDHLDASPPLRVLFSFSPAQNKFFAQAVLCCSLAKL